jgi:FixJ family two-component response regulator
MAAHAGQVIANPNATVLIIDDDQAVRDALGRLLRSVGLESRAFGSVVEFLDIPRPDVPTCLVLDVRLPGRSGLEFQRELMVSDNNTPIIFITGHGDIAMSVQAMKSGAIEFLTKPFRDQDLIDAIQLGLARDQERRENEKFVQELKERYQGLSPREREIMGQVVRGRLNKQIAWGIGISEVTVKVHRSNLMKKMKAQSLPELSRMADHLKLTPEAG